MGFMDSAYVSISSTSSLFTLEQIRSIHLITRELTLIFPITTGLQGLFRDVAEPAQSQIVWVVNLGKHTCNVV